MTATALTVFLLQPKLVAVSSKIAFANPKAPVYPRLALGKAWNEVGFFWPLSVFTLINIISYHIVLASLMIVGQAANKLIISELYDLFC
jgi:hypothetical protein